MRDKNSDPVCPNCGNTADNIDVDTGLCDYCLESSSQKSARRASELQDRVDTGHLQSWDDF